MYLNKNSFYRGRFDNRDVYLVLEDVFSDEEFITVLNMFTGEKENMYAHYLYDRELDEDEYREFILCDISNRYDLDKLIVMNRLEKVKIELIVVQSFLSKMYDTAFTPVASIDVSMESLQEAIDQLRQDIISEEIQAAWPFKEGENS